MPDCYARRVLRRFLPAGVLVLMLAPAAQAQPQVLDTSRPRIALAQDGSFAVAWEALVQDIATAWMIAVQRYSPAGSPVGPTHYFQGESCSGLDIWISDFMEHVELAFQSDGTLLVLMTHTGELSLGGDGIFTSESTLGAIAANGQQIDLNGSGNCVQQKLIFIGGDRQTRPRLAVGPDDSMYMIHQGGFDDPEAGDSWSTNVALRVLDASGNEVVEQFIPHDDPTSRDSFHAYPDIAVSASTILTVWHECVMIDNQGNSNDCDIGAQFFDGQSGQPVGTNRKINDVGVGQAETYSLWPSVAMNASGNSVVVWADSRTGDQGDIFAQRFSASGQPVGANLQVSTGQGLLSRRPEVAMLDDGRFTVVWEDTSAAGVFRTRARFFAANGVPEGPPFELSSDPTLETGFPSVATNGGAFVYAWAGARQAGRPVAVFTSNLGKVVANEHEEARSVAAFDLESYPNPFTGRTTIRYGVSATMPVRLVVYDVLGREVAQLVDRVEGPGRREVALDGSTWPAGLYLIRLQQGEQTQTRVLVRR